MAATVPERYRKDCRTARPIPALVMHGTLDTISSWSGLPVPGAELLSAAESAQYYAELAGCMTHTDDALPARDAQGTKVAVRRWSICRDSAAVMLYAIEGGGHMPPSYQRGRGETFVSIFLPRRSHVIDAAEEIWQFFRQFRRDPDTFQRGTSSQ
jgi:poly(3-hydroxybutyrate) depolymerase